MYYVGFDIKVSLMNIINSAVVPITTCGLRWSMEGWHWPHLWNNYWDLCGSLVLTSWQYVYMYLAEFLLWQAGKCPQNEYKFKLSPWTLKAMLLPASSSIHSARLEVEQSDNWCDYQHGPVNPTTQRVTTKTRSARSQPCSVALLSFSWNLCVIMLFYICYIVQSTILVIPIYMYTVQYLFYRSFYCTAIETVVVRASITYSLCRSC